jgi:hypothetical protein
MSNNYKKHGCPIEKEEIRRKNMENETKQKQENCVHEFVFDKSRMLMIFPSRIKGVCKKCGKQIVVSSKQELENKKK